MATTQEILSGLLGAGGSLAAAYLPYEATSGEMSALKDIVSGFKTDVGALSEQLTGVSQFKPFTVTTPSGTTDVTEGGGLDMQLGQVPGAIQTGLLGSAQTAAGALGGLAPDVSGLQQTALAGAGTALEGATAQDQALAAQQLAMQGLFTGQLGTFGLPQQTLEGLTGTALLGAQTGLETQAPDVTGAYTGISAPQVSQAAGGLAQQALGAADLQPSVADVTGLFSGIQAPSVSQAASDVASQYLTAGQQALGAATPTAASLYQDIRAMQTPEEERQRIALENRLAAQGRLGVSTAAYGGTPEQLALAKAQEEARNTAAFQATQMADQLATSAQNRAQQLTAQGLNAEQVQAQLNAEGFGQAMQLAGANLQAIQAQSNLTTEAQNRGTQLAQLGLSADQIQQQMINEGFNQEMALGAANIGAQQAQSGLQTEQQARAAQLAQLGLTGTQAGQQLTTQQLANLTGLQQATMAGATGQQALQQGALGIGTGLFGLGAQAAQLPQQMTAADIANLQGMLGAAYIPQTQQIAAMTPAVQLANIAQAARQGELEALYKTGIAGLQAQAEGAGAVATLEAQRSRALADALQGLFAGGSNVASGTKSATTTSPVDKLLDIILGGSDVPDDQLTRDQYFDKYGYFPEELNL